MSDPRTLNELFFSALDRFADRPVAMRSKLAGRWVDLSYRELEERISGLAFGLRELGIQPGEKVAILSENRPEWAMADYACLINRCADVPIYPTLPAKQAEYILRDSESVAVFASTQPQVEKIQAIRANLPGLRHVIAFDARATGPGALHLDEVIARGRDARARYASWREEALRVQPGDLATLIYTSGTTGDPKGVMLSHGNITSNVVCGLRVLRVTEQDECLSFLPLSHIFERMIAYVMWYGGTIINYAESVDTVAQDMLDRRPTVLVAVPRLYEKIYARVLESASASPVKARLFAWAKRVGDAWARLHSEHKPVPTGLAVQHAIADRLVFRKLRERTGGRLRFFVSGGAALNPDLGRFFYAAGLPILEGYGLTETSPVITVNTFEHLRIGTVGRPIPGVEVKIAEDGEILTRGPHVMQGYYRKPEATAEAIDAEGWFHTGDIGEIDQDGYLRITDRKKDIIVTAGGKNIAPQPIENRVKASKYVLNAVMLGDRRKFPILLVVPNLAALRDWASSRGLTVASDAELLDHPETEALMEREIGRHLEDLASFERPKRVVLIERDFSIESGELTPSLKVRRRVVEEHYRERIETVYAEAETYSRAG